MIELNSLHVGDKVRIVDRWNEHTCENTSGLMDRWLGTVMTVARIGCFSASMVEDDGKWAWNSDCIEEIVYDTPIDLDDLM